MVVFFRFSSPVEERPAVAHTAPFAPCAPSGRSGGGH